MALPAAWLGAMDVASHPLAAAPHRASLELPELAELRKVEENRRKSLGRISQDFRGITLQELKDLRDENKMQEPRWFCVNYPRQCQFSTDSAIFLSGAQTCPSCGAASGTVRAPNLYELVSEVVKPQCRAEEISYVEFLKRREGRMAGRKVNTFVSHWWGEEFKDLVASLDRYATSRCILRQRLRLWTFLHSMGALSLNWLLFHFPWGQEILHRAQTEHVATICANEPQAALWFVGWNASITILILLFLMLEALWNKEQAKDWTFWICAFANNQYKLEHALGKGGNLESSAFATALSGDIQSVVCIIDPSCVIYTRIWCAFELFYVKCVLKEEKPELPIVLINDKGLISEGGLRKEVMKDIEVAIGNVRTAEAEATQESDKKKINEYISERGYSYDQLDETLKDLTKVGLDNVQLRRRAVLIYCFLCPMASFVFSDFIFFSVMLCRPESPQWIAFRESRKLYSVRFKVGFYFISSLFTCVVICMASLGSLEVLSAQNSSGSAGGSDMTVPGIWGRTKAAFQRFKEVKRLTLRLNGPALFSRLQSRVLYKVFMTISTLMGPGLTPSVMAGILLLLMKQSKDDDDFAHQVESSMEFLWILREVWNMVQLVYAIMGLVVGFIYWYVRDRKIGKLRTFLEEIIL